MMRGSASARAFAGGVALIVAGIASIGGCGDYGPVTLSSPDAGANPDDLRARGVGEACSDTIRCRAGLTCNNALCAPGRALEEGAACVINAECKEGLYCAASRKCAPGGARVAGDACASEADCAAGARCNPIGLSAECQPEGTADVGAACKTNVQCYGGLLCKAGVCTPPPVGAMGAAPVAVSAFAGVVCQDQPGPVASYFRVPRGKDDGDFFRLPFPNDVRRPNGRLNLLGFPTPGSDVLGYDLVDRWVRYAEETASGFSAYPTITLRFSGTPDLPTLKGDGVVRMVDVTTGGTGDDVSIAWSATNVASKYVCANSITARPPTGVPLVQGHSYALLVTNGAKAPGGAAIEVAPDLKAVLGFSDPGAPLTQAWEAYGRLRVWATTKAFDLNTLVHSTVFTVGKHTDLAANLAAAIEAAPAPAVTGWVRCGAGPSPCPQAEGTRACGAVDPKFDELHALVTLSTWQKGTAPYRTPTEGGDVAVDEVGVPASQGTSQVCLSLTVPKDTMPVAGWPLAIYAHDVGGSFRSHVTDGVAARLSAADGGAAKIAVLGIDQIGHGTRRGGTTARPESLWFGTSNPRAIRGFSLQAAADVLALVKLGATLDLGSAFSPTGAEIRFGDMMLVGHGQGASTVAIAGPQAPIKVKGVALGGIGASFLDSVVVKRNPVDFASVAPAVLGETVLTPAHPVLSIFQNGLDAVDPLDHAALLVTAPVTQGRHAFVMYGRGDSFTPGPTQLAYTSSASLGVAAHPVTLTSPDDLTGGKPLLPIPAGGNLNGFTAIARQYDRANYEGHLVMLLSDDAKRDLDRFATDLALAKVPMIGR